MKFSRIIPCLFCVFGLLLFSACTPQVRNEPQNAAEEITAEPTLTPVELTPAPAELTPAPAEPSEADRNDFEFYAAWSDRSKAEVETFAKEVRKAILDRDWETLSGFCLYPITVSGSTVETPESFLAEMNEAEIPEDFFKQVESESCEAMSSNYLGCMFGNGEVWISCRASDPNAEQYDMGVIALNF